MQIPSTIRNHPGFTIIEVLVILSVLGILVTVGTFGYSYLQIWSQNNARATEVEQWASTFELYKTRFAGYPIMPTTDGTTYFCLGSFASYSNKCGQYSQPAGTKNIDASLSASMLTEVAKVGNAPSNATPPIVQQVIGPYVALTQQTSGGSPSTITVTAKFVGIFQGTSCPNNSSLTAVSPASGYIAGLTDVIECSTSKSLSYTN